MRILLLGVACLIGGRLFAQSIEAIINPAAVKNIEAVLSSDDMRGRKTFSPDIERAASYIAGQFKDAGLKTLDGGNGYLQPFSMISTRLVSAQVVADGISLPAGSVVLASAAEHLSVDENTAGYEKVFIRAGDDIRAQGLKYINQQTKNYIVFVDTSFSAIFPRLSRFTGQTFKSSRNVIMVLTAASPAHFSIEVTQTVTENKLANVVGILPGGSKKDEYVIFSAHYDHLGIGKPNDKQDSIFNGANDDASGSTAVIMLAKYFSRLKNNARTLVFVTFTAEEIGGFGSQYFSHQMDPAKVQAMFNIEMIGTESKWGINSAYITGYEKTDMGKILGKNLEGSQFSFHPDPYPDQQLFYRSDNATLARQGVPAHTISTSKMDSEKYYHTQGDEIGTLDMENMARIIRAIAISSRTIVGGTDTPGRVDSSQLK